jgi:hypothetical protein
MSGALKHFFDSIYYRRPGVALRPVRAWPHGHLEACCELRALLAAEVAGPLGRPTEVRTDARLG